MFEVGKDIFKHGFSGVRGEATGRKRLRVMYTVFLIAFMIFIGRTLQLGIQGTDRARLAGADGEWNVQRADIVDRNGDILAKGSTGNGQIRYGADVINRIIEQGRSGGKKKCREA